MNARDFILERHEAAHRNLMTFLEPLTEEQIRCRPHDSLNSIIWLLWHVARCEDAYVNRLVTDRPQVFDEGNWGERMHLPRRDLGIGMPSEEVTEISERIDFVALKAYITAVAARTVEVVESLNFDELDGRAEPEHFDQVMFGEGALRPYANWAADMYRPSSKGQLLSHLAVTHVYGHGFEVLTIRSLFGIHGL